ncbi:MAG: ABC transporter substrate-binding protein [Colwellia sp.]|nr:ABC transporter substrate-binding protein [Colwellia sp.]MCW8866297.1 ABC transporter substrate-binding protein [Colwellia sp.]MCW9081511.1 ABC transporter substrate-binding protein [Colwellia sp.]
MNKFVNFSSRIGLLILCLFPCFFLQADDTIELIAGLSKPPFVVENDPKNSGIQLDLIKAIFAEEKQDVRFVHMPLARSFARVEKWHSDGVITLPSNYEHENVNVSAPYVSYQNVIVTLKEDNLSINTLADLQGKRIIAFQAANKFLSAEFVEAIAGAAEYREIADQMRQIKMLFAKRTEVLVLDINIFRHFLHNNRDSRYAKPYEIHQLFPPRVYSAGFKSKRTRDQFNRGLIKIKASGGYQKILDKYLL